MHTRLSRRALNQGFTLIEILTVLAIIGILTAVLVPAVSKALERSRLTSTVAEIRSLKIIVAEAANRLNGFLPITEGFRRNPSAFLNTGSMQVVRLLSRDPQGGLDAIQQADLNAVNLDRGLTYSKLVRLDHVLTTLSPPLMDSPWRTQFGGGAIPGAMVQGPIRFDERYLTFRSSTSIPPTPTLYNLDDANIADDSSRYSRIESATIVDANSFNIANPALADVNTAGGIRFDIDGNGAAGQLNRQCAYVIYKDVPIAQAYKLAREFNSAGLMTDTAPGGIAPQTSGTVIYGLPVGGVADVYVHLLTL